MIASLSGFLMAFIIFSILLTPGMILIMFIFGYIDLKHKFPQNEHNNQNNKQKIHEKRKPTYEEWKAAKEKERSSGATEHTKQ